MLLCKMALNVEFPAYLNLNDFVESIVKFKKFINSNFKVKKYSGFGSEFPFFRILPDSDDVGQGTGCILASL